jgi:hypothetical protein
MSYKKFQKLYLTAGSYNPYLIHVQAILSNLFQEMMTVDGRKTITDIHTCR